MLSKNNVKKMMMLTMTFFFIKIHIFFWLAAMVGFSLIFGCGTQDSVSSSPPSNFSPKPYRVGDNWYYPVSQVGEFREKGIASWYGEDFHGKKTSSGEIYDMYDMTAAHKILPFGTYVRVKNLTNGRSVDVRINDRGPFVGDRIIDLSYKAAKKIKMIEPGTAPVKITVLSADGSSTASGESHNFKTTEYFSGIFSVQVGSFQDWDNAEKLRKDLASNYDDARIVTYQDGSDTFYRVRVGQYTSVDEVMASEKQLLENGYKGAFSVAE